MINKFEIEHMLRKFMQINSFKFYCFQFTIKANKHFADTTIAKTIWNYIYTSIALIIHLCIHATLAQHPPLGWTLLRNRPAASVYCVSIVENSSSFLFIFVFVHFHANSDFLLSLCIYTICYIKCI